MTIILRQVIRLLIHHHHLLIVILIRKRLLHFRFRWQCNLPPMRIRFLIWTKLISCLIHQEVMFCTHLVHGCLDLLVEGTYVAWLLVLGVLLDQHLTLFLHFMCLFNRCILHFIVGSYSSNVVGVAWQASQIRVGWKYLAWRLTISSNLFMNLAHHLFRSKILLMRSSVRYILI